MKRGVPKSKNRQAHPGLVGSWTKNREVTKSYQSTFKGHARQYGIRQRISHWMNGEAVNPKTAKTFAILFLVVTSVLGGAFLAQGSLFHSHEYFCTIQMLGTLCQDPTTYLWTRTNNAPNSLADFNLSPGQRQTYITNCDGLGSGQDCLRLDPKPGNNSVAISTNPINDLSVALSKTMGILGSFIMDNANASFLTGVSHSWGFFITQNATAPAHNLNSTSQYSVFDDPSVVFAVRTSCSSGTCGGNSHSATYNTQVYVRRHVGDTLNQEDTGVCSSASSCIMGTSGTDVTECPSGGPCSGANLVNIESAYLNFTGTTTSTTTCAINTNVLAGPGCSWICAANSAILTLTYGSSCSATATLPPNPFGAGDFHYGVWDNIGNIAFDWEFQPGTPPALGGTNGMQVTAFVPAPSCNNAGSNTGQVCPNIDTGGFFGPIIKALINIGIFILAGILQFVSIVASLIITAMNVVGNFLGIGPLGTDMVNLFSTILSFVSNVFANFFTWFSSIFSTIGNAFLALTVLLTTYFTQITAFFAGLVGFLTFLWTVVSAVLQYGSYPVAFSITIWWVWGMFAAYDDGIEGFLGWVDMSEAVLFKGLNVLIWFGEETMKGIARLRTILPRPAGI